MYNKVACLCLLLAFYAPTFQSKRELPTFLKVCHRHDPNVNECIKSSIEMIKPYLGKGIPEMHVVPFDPLRVTQLVLNDGSVKFQYDDLDFYKLDQFKVVNVEYSYDKCTANLSFNIPFIHLESRYKVRGRLLVFELEGEGKIYANFTDVSLTAQANCSREIIKNKEFALFRHMDVKLTFQDYHLHLTDLFKNNPELTERTNAVLNENSQSLISEFQPLVQSGIQEIVLSSVRNVFDTFPLEEILPA